MKKTIIASLLLLFIIVMVACNGEENKEKGSDKDHQNDEKGLSNETLHAEDIFDKALEASKDIKSAEIEINMEQEINGAVEETVFFSTSGTTTVTFDPISLHQDLNTNTKMGDHITDAKAEMYILNDTMYMFNEELDQWLKFDEESVSGIGQFKTQLDPEGQLNSIKNYIGDFDVEAAENGYLLTLQASEEAYPELKNKLIESNLADELFQGSEAESINAEDVTLNEVVYEIRVDKGTFQLNEFTLDVDMNIAADDGVIQTTQKTVQRYLSFNEVGSIGIPEEVTESAISPEEAQKMRLEQMEKERDKKS